MRVGRRVEAALLGAALLRPNTVAGLGWLPPAAFNVPGHSELWRMLHRMNPRDVTPMAVTEALENADAGLRQCLSPSRLSTLIHACLSPRNVQLYAGMVLDAAIHRGLDRVGSEFTQRATSAVVDEVADALAQGQEIAEQRLPALAASWSAAPEIVRTLLDTAPAEEIATADRSARSRVDLPAEAETVASLMYRPEQISDVADWLRADDFSDPQLRASYDAMTTLADHRAPINPLTVAWEAARRPDPQPSEQLLDELERNGRPCAAAYAGETVLAAAALDRMDATGRHLRDLSLLPLGPSRLARSCRHRPGTDRPRP